MRKTIASIIVASLLVSIQGPAFQAAAQSFQVQQVRPVPSGVAAFSGASLSGNGLSRTQSLALPNDLSAPILQTQPGAARASTASAKYRSLRAYAKGRKANEALKQKKAEALQKLISRVVSISDAMEAKELGAQGTEKSRDASDHAWDASAKAASDEAPALDPGAAAPLPENLLQAKAEDKAEASTRERAPPAPAVKKGMRRFLTLLKARFLGSRLLRKQARPEKPSRQEMRFTAALKPSRFAPISRVLDAVPGPIRIALAAAATAGLEFATHSLSPAVFGFAPAASLWTVLGVGAVVAPLLIIDRLRLSKDKDAAISPLKKYEDALIGAFIGAAIVCALAVAGSEAPFLTLVSSGFENAANKFSPAPFLGLLSMVAAMPLLYSSGHLAWGLKNQRTVKPEMPLPLIFKIFLVNIILMPGQIFMALTGNIGMPIMSSIFGILPVLIFMDSGTFLEQMTIRHASPEEVARETEYLKAPWTRGLLDPEPEMGAEWTVGNGPADDSKIKPVIRKEGKGLLAVMAVMPILAMGAVALFNLSFASIPQALPMLWKQVSIAVPLFFSAGMITPLFFGAKRVTTGPTVDMVRDLAEKARLPMPKVYEGADQTKSPNAFAAGAAYHLSVVAVIGSIRKLLTEREMRGVIGHELSHVKYRHMLSFLAAIICVQLMAFSSMSTLLQVFLAMWAPLAWLMLFMVSSRHAERMADSGSALLTQDPRALGTGLRKMAIMSMLTRKVPSSASNWFYKLFLNHPETHERVRDLSGMIRKP
jgi:heat shock protein HtpX